jgi:hypothetical protein
MLYIASRAVNRRADAACWDPRLASLMSDAGRRIKEEQVLDELIGDLST